MAKSSNDVQQSTLMFTISFFVVMVINAFVFGLANQLFPTEVVLGTMSISYNWAILLSAGALSLITILVMPLFNEWELRNGKLLTPVQMILGYLVVNFAGLWLVTRAAEIFGLGVASWMVVLALAVVLDLLQGVVMMALEQVRKNYLT